MLECFDSLSVNLKKDPFYQKTEQLMNSVVRERLTTLVINSPVRKNHGNDVTLLNHFRQGFERRTSPSYDGLNFFYFLFSYRGNLHRFYMMQFSGSEIQRSLKMESPTLLFAST